jgi:hypothetical protein
MTFERFITILFYLFGTVFFIVASLYLFGAATMSVF